jgi:anti-sigma regulatory factor (Ser/Thr protein kinase)
MARLAPPEGYGDDVAVVLYRNPAPLDLVFPAEAGQLAAIRGRLRNWLDSCSPGPATIQNSLVAAGEAIANAIEHGYQDQAGQQVRLHAVATAGQLRLTISDSGHWQPPGPDGAPYRGKGIPLMRALMDNVSIDAGPAGTTVTMDVRITRDHIA